MFLVQKGILRGVSVWNVRETGGQESHCPGHEKCHVCGDLVFLSSNICRKTSFRVDNIIELLLKQSRDIVKFVAVPFPDVYLKALLFF